MNYRPYTEEFGTIDCYIAYLVGYKAWRKNVREPRPEGYEVPVLTAEQLVSAMHQVAEIIVLSDAPIDFGWLKKETGYQLTLVSKKVNRPIFILYNNDALADLLKMVAEICWEVETPYRNDVASRPPVRGDLVLCLVTGRAGYLKKLYTEGGDDCGLMIDSLDDEPYNVLLGDLSVVLRVDDL